MSSISTWSTTAASNNSSPPDGAPEGMAPSTVNNIIREVMAQVRTWYEDAQWIDLGDTPTQASSTTFTISGNVTATYHVGRRIKCTDSSTLYGTITASSYGAPNTTVTVSLDSGSLTGSLSAVALGVLSNTNPASPPIAHYRKGADVASASALPVLADGNYFDVTGTTTITSINSLGIGTVIRLHFDGALTLTHHATDLILPGGANITTAAGDEAEFVEYAAGDWRCTSYQRAGVSPWRQASESNTGVVELATNAEVQAGTDTVRAVTPAGLASFGNNFASAGYANLPGGMQIRWGSNSFTSGGASISFNQAFSNACLAVTISKTTASAPDGGVSSLSTTGFTGTGNGGDSTHYWIAVGY